MALSGDQSKLLHEALVSAFTYDELQRLTWFNLNVMLPVVVANGPVDRVVYDLIKYAEQHGIIEDLVRAASESRPRNPLVKKAASLILAPGGSVEE